MVYRCFMFVVWLVLVGGVGPVRAYTVQDSLRPKGEPPEVEITEPIRVFVFVDDERSDVPTALTQLGSGSTRTNSYAFNLNHGRQAVRTLEMQLQKNENRQQLMMVVPSRSQADLFVEIVATNRTYTFSAESAVSRGSAFGSSGWLGVSGSRVGHHRQERVIVAEVSVRNNDFSMRLFGRRRNSIVLSPSVILAAMLEEWIEKNHDGLLRVIYGL